MVIWVWLEDVGWHEMILVTTNCTGGEDVESGREDKGEYRSCYGTGMREHQCKNCEQDGQEC